MIPAFKPSSRIQNTVARVLASPARSFRTSAALTANVKTDVFRPTDEFESRHIGPNDKDIAAMLRATSSTLTSLERLMDETVPSSIRLTKPVVLPEGLTESQALAKLKTIASKNIVKKNMIGMGYYDTHTPGVILRTIMENPQWYTSYTPYQAEISQGRLESLLNYQTMVCDLTKMDISNASLLDEGTAAAEAMNMAFGNHNTKRTKFFVASDIHPQTLDVVRTRADGYGITVDVGNPLSANYDSNEYCGVLLQYPSTYGAVNSTGLEKVASLASKSKTVVIVATDLLALTLMKAPGDLGAQIAVGSSQRFGVPLGFGGPHAGFLACREDQKRRMPGRVIGVSIDAQQNRALRMAMQTREQHIRRDKATSNICTAQALLANMAAMYAVYHGPEGLKRIATRCRTLTGTLMKALSSAGYTVGNGTTETVEYFDTFIVKTKNGQTADSILNEAVKLGINLRKVDNTTVGISVDERTNREHIIATLAAFGVNNVDIDKIASTVAPVHSNAARTSAYLTHPVFNTHHSETQLLRYITKLQSKDLSLAQSMISLGSCTMKLNATSEMIPVTWPEFANIHPFAPPNQALGYKEMIDSLSVWLASITGFAAVSVQPNSGAAGEYAGLMAIRAYLKAKNQSHRNVCLIPVSAHGTNPASAVMAGMKVVVVASDDKGNIDMADLKKKAIENKDKLGALMVTYPSTYGVFEEGIREIIDTVHQNGGQVYMDGANMNAQVALTSPGFIGADVCHLNLHKTFCIPHGGGGPGVGAIGVAKHLAPYLPSHPVIPTGGTGDNVVEKTEGLTISAAPYGSALILPISWMYIAMLGETGLRKATQVAILNANYLAARVAPYYNLLYTGTKGRVAHEFIIDMRPLKAQANNHVDEQDVAKRLMDYGFHAPTMSWPVPGTLMIEPTESEDKGELDRFADALISIRQEIEDVITGKAHPENNVLKNAPHTAAVIASDKWDRPYSREQAAFPAPWVKESKFWPTVGRVDNVHGDRNLICTCPPLESYTSNNK